MLFLTWILVSAVLVGASQLLLRRLSTDVASQPFGWQLILLRLACMALSGALIWWLFDVPGLLEQTRLVQSGDLEAAAAAHQPLIRW